MATPPLSSDSSSTSSPTLSYSSPEQLTKTENTDHMAFDNPETLELILQTLTQNMDSPAAHDAHDEWSQMSSWTTAESKHPDMGSDFDFTFPMDLDFDATMAVDPSALHFNTSMFSQPTLPENQYLFSAMSQREELMASSIFSNDQTLWTQNSHTEARTGRRLSITSSSSSSGASLSPILEPQSTASNSSSSASSDCGDYSLNESDPAYELAQRVRETAGVTLAVPVSAQVQQLAAASTQPKVAIPRLSKSNTPPLLKRQNSAASSVGADASISLVATPLPESEPSSAAQSPIPDPPVVLGVSGRPKTSHTTIERRYRTNLNARITGLKQAVPALRVLELKNGDTSPYNDVVDARGFVDGVKVARKMSKANVLGKATEYIRVLKKREARLKKEKDGLKSLISGLVGGPALLREWDREWKDKFGGEERDEIEGDDAAGGSDYEDGDGDESDADDGEDGRARKKAKVVKPPKKEKPTKPSPPPPTPLVPGAVPEKRKRGRPRKVPLPSAPVTLQPMEGVSSVAPLASNQSASPYPPQEFVVATAPSQPTQQYLLAAFAFFSVFNSPLASSFGHAQKSHDHSHPHHGSVLTSQPSMIPTPSFSAPVRAYGIQEWVQAFHLLVSTLVFFYVVFPWLTGIFRRNLASGVLQKLRSSFVRGHRSDDTWSVKAQISTPRVQAYQRTQLMDALSPTTRGSADEGARLRRALGVSSGVYGLLQSVIKAVRVDRGLEMNQLEQRAWVRLGELIAFDESVARSTRLQTYWCMSWHVSTFATSTSDLSTLALIILPISRTKAAELWSRARSQEVLRPYEKIVLSNMSVEDAAEWLSRWHQWRDDEHKEHCVACEKRTPLGVLAAIMTRERLRKHAAAMFVRTVAPSGPYAEINAGYGRDLDESTSEYDPEQEDRDDLERRETIEAGKSIGGCTAALATFLERIWDTGFAGHDDILPYAGGRRSDEEFGCEDEHDLARSNEAEIRTLLSATLIYRRIFPSSFPSCATAVSVILSPPPSPSRKNMALHVSLRAALASSAFDFDADRFKDERLSSALEDARDRVNDMLTALERSVRRNARV